MLKRSSFLLEKSRSNLSLYYCSLWLAEEISPSQSRRKIIGSLSSDVFERHTSTGSGLFALLRRDFEQIFGQIVSIRIKTLENKNTVGSRLIKREKGSLPVDVRRSKTSLLKLPNMKVQRNLYSGDTLGDTLGTKESAPWTEVSLE